MLARALRSGQQLFKFAPKVVIPEDPTSKPNLILKLMGFYNKDSVLPRQAKKLYTAAKDQARGHFVHPLNILSPIPYPPFPSRSEYAPSFLRKCWYRPAISHRVSNAISACMDDIWQTAQCDVPTTHNRAIFLVSHSCVQTRASTGRNFRKKFSISCGRT